MGTYYCILGKPVITTVLLPIGKDYLSEDLTEATHLVSAMLVARTIFLTPLGGGLNTSFCEAVGSREWSGITSCADNTGSFMIKSFT